MKNPRLRILNYVLAVCNVLLAAFFYPYLPAMIPMNWQLNGSIASYSEKYQLFLMSGLAVLLALLFDFLPHIDPRKKNYQKFGGYYDSFCIVMQLFLIAMTGIVLTESFRPGTLSVPTVIFLFLGFLFIFIGNMLPKVKSNFYMGFKTPWTLSSDEIWRKTHRLGGKCFFLAGLIVIICAFLPWKAFANLLVLCSILILTLIPTVMSYIWWRKEQ
jgi:uncharacterized membrane protein